MALQKVSESASHPAITSNEMDPGDETGTERFRDDQAEHAQTCDEIGLLQTVQNKTPQQMSVSASDPVITSNRMDPGEETGTGERHKEQIPLLATPHMTPSHMTPQHDADCEYINRVNASKI